MKKLTIILTLLFMTGCAQQTAPAATAVPPADNYYTVCHLINGGMQAAGKGRYELMRHTDGSADIIFTDIATCTRQALSEETTTDIPHEVVTGIFARDGRLYHYSHGAPLAMKKPGDTAVLYQYTMDGSLIQYTEIAANIELDMDSAVVSDGQWLYISGRETVHTADGVEDRVSHIFAINRKTLETEKVYTPEKAGIKLIGGYKDNLIVEMKPYTVGKDGVKMYKDNVELLNMHTLKRTGLLIPEYPVYNYLEGKLINPYAGNGSITVYDIDSRSEEAIPLFDGEKATGFSIALHYVADNHAFISTSSYTGNVTENYIYDFETATLSPAPDFCSMPFVYVADSDSYIVPVGYENIPVAGGYYTVYDNNYAAIKADDYYSGIENLALIRNNIDYR